MKKLNKENIKDILSVVGIYRITVNSKEYIGSSTGIGNRLKHHIWSLESKNHHNRTMQNLYNKYGSEMIMFEIVEECNADVLIEREKYYIDTTKPYINHILDPVKIVRDETYKRRLSEGGKRSFKNGRQIHNQKETHMYTLDGVYVKSFKNASIAVKEILKKDDPSAICAVCTNNTYSAGGYRWSYVKVEKLPELKKKYKLVQIEQLDMNNVLIKEWDSITSASNTLKITNITRAIKNNLTAGGYKWKYKNL